MKASGIRLVLIACCVALSPTSAEAARLGGLTIFSAIGEPFSAEIGLDANAEELATLVARIAPPEEYADQGIDYGSSLSAVHVEVVKRPNNKPVVRLNSSQPHAAPYMDMLIQIEWSSGRLMREYTTVPNVPVFSQQPTPEKVPEKAIVPSNIAPLAPVPESTVKIEKPAPVKVEVTSAAASAVPESIPAPPPPPVPQPVQPSSPLPPAKTEPEPVVPTKADETKVPDEPKHEQVVQSRPASSTKSYTTKRGDTLHAIASRMKIKGVSTEQMLAGLLKANKDAFIRGNINRLKAGRKIHVPAREYLLAKSQIEAREEIRLQTADWGTYRMNLAATAMESSSPEEQPVQQSSEGKIKSIVEPTPAPAAASSRDVVKLSSGGAHDGKSGKSSLKKQLSALEDDAIASNRELKQSEEKHEILTKQLENMQKLLEIKNQILAEKARIAGPVSSDPMDYIRKHPFLFTFGCASLLAMLTGAWFYLRRRIKQANESM